MNSNGELSSSVTSSNLSSSLSEHDRLMIPSSTNRHEVIVTDADLRSRSFHISYRSLNLNNKTCEENEIWTCTSCSCQEHWTTGKMNDDGEIRVHPICTCVCAWRLMNEIGLITFERCHKKPCPWKWIKLLLHQVNEIERSKNVDKVFPFTRKTITKH